MPDQQLPPMFTPNVTTTTFDDGTSSESLIIPVIEEYLTIDKELVETGRVRVSKTAIQVEQRIDTELTHDEVGIVRIPMNVYVDAPPPVRQEGDTTIIPIVSEIAVVEKRLVVIEEVRVTKRSVQGVAHHEVPLQHEEVVVERVAPTTK